MGPASKKRVQKYKKNQYLRQWHYEMFFFAIVGIFFVGCPQKILIFAPSYGSVFGEDDMVKA